MKTTSIVGTTVATAMLILLGIASAQPAPGAAGSAAGSATGSGSAAGSAAPAAGSAAPAAGSAAPAAGSAAPAAGSGAGSGSAAWDAATAASWARSPHAGAMPPGAVGYLRKTCTDAMNADPSFAASIVATADQNAQKKRDAETVKAQLDANAHIQENQRHVVIAYGAMWIIAALFVLFLWRRQQGLKTEIAQLRRDLEAAAK